MCFLSEVGMPLRSFLHKREDNLILDQYYKKHCHIFWDFLVLRFCVSCTDEYHIYCRNIFCIRTTKLKIIVSCHIFKSVSLFLYPAHFTPQSNNTKQSRQEVSGPHFDVGTILSWSSSWFSLWLLSGSSLWSLSGFSLRSLLGFSSWPLSGFSLWSLSWSFLEPGCAFSSHT